MSSSKAWIISVILLFWAIGASGVGAFYYLQYTTTDQAYNTLLNDYSDLTDYEEILANVGLDYGNGTVVWFNQTRIPFNSTALYLTNQTAEVDSTYYEGLGYFINGINGVMNNASGNNAYWLWSLNGDPVFIGADSYFVKFGDVILWTYTSF